MFKENHIPRGIRNNNPGNIVRTKERWMGLSSDQRDPRFLTFQSIEWGYRALIKLLSNYIRLRKLDTVALIIQRWAPSHEKNTEAYISFVCRTTGLGRNQKLSADKATLTALAAAISEHENGRPARSREVEEGWRLFEQSVR